MQYNNLLGHNLKALPGGKFTPLIFENRKSEIKNPSSHNLRTQKKRRENKPKASRRKEIIKVEINQIRCRKTGKKKMKQYASSLKRAKK